MLLLNVTPLYGARDYVFAWRDGPTFVRRPFVGCDAGQPDPLSRRPLAPAEMHVSFAEWVQPNQFRRGVRSDNPVLPRLVTESLQGLLVHSSLHIPEHAVDLM